MDQTYTEGTPFLDLPPKVELTVDVEFSARERLVYAHSKTKITEELRNENSTNWWSMWHNGASKLRQLASNFLNAKQPFTTGIVPAQRHSAAQGGAYGSGGGWGARDAIVGNNGATPAEELPVKELAVVLETLGKFPKGVAAGIKEQLETPAEDFECPICYEQAEDCLGLTECGHVFCPGCILPIASAQEVCPICRQAMRGESTVTLVRVGEEAPAAALTTEPSMESVASVAPEGDPGAKASPEEQFAYLKTQRGAKINAMLKALRDVRADEPQAKFVIFTQFEKTLNAIVETLAQEKVGHCMIGGAMSQSQRSSALSQFASDEDCVVFVLSMRSGACGLNLTAANHVFLMEPGLNPALELQAIGRCHRITQTKTVYAHRFIMKDTIEEVCHSLSYSSRNKSHCDYRTHLSGFVQRPRRWWRWQDQHYDGWPAFQVFRAETARDKIGCSQEMPEGSSTPRPNNKPSAVLALRIFAKKNLHPTSRSLFAIIIP